MKQMVTEEIRSLAQVAANTMAAPVEVGTEQIQPTAQALVDDQERLRKEKQELMAKLAEAEARIMKAEVDAAFPDPKPPVPKQGHLPV